MAFGFRSNLTYRIPQKRWSYIIQIEFVKGKRILALFPSSYGQHTIQNMKLALYTRTQKLKIRVISSFPPPPPTNCELWRTTIGYLRKNNFIFLYMSHHWVDWCFHSWTSVRIMYNIWNIFHRLNSFWDFSRLDIIGKNWAPI